jgi:hypothetical protein
MAQDLARADFLLYRCPIPGMLDCCPNQEIYVLTHAGSRGLDRNADIWVSYSGCSQIVRPDAFLDRWPRARNCHSSSPGLLATPDLPERPNSKGAQMRSTSLTSVHCRPRPHPLNGVRRVSDHSQSAGCLLTTKHHLTVRHIRRQPIELTDWRRMRVRSEAGASDLAGYWSTGGERATDSHIRKPVPSVRPDSGIARSRRSGVRFRASPWCPSSLVCDQLCLVGVSDRPSDEPAERPAKCHLNDRAALALPSSNPFR